MLINELLTLMDREVDLLTAENNHSAAALMACGAARIRLLARCVDERHPHGEPPNVGSGGSKR